MDYYYLSWDIKKFIETWPGQKATPNQREKWPEGISLQMLGNQQANSLLLLIDDGFDGQSVFSVSQSSINKLLNPTLLHSIFPKTSDLIRFALFMGLSEYKTLHLLLKMQVEKSLIKYVRKNFPNTQSYYDIGKYSHIIKEFPIGGLINPEKIIQAYTEVPASGTHLSAETIRNLFKNWLADGQVLLSNYSLTEPEQQLPEAEKNTPSFFAKKKKPLIYALIAAVLLGAGGFSLRSFRTSAANLPQQPVYSSSELTQMLFQAVKRNDLPMVRQWISRGASVNTADKVGWSLLMEAADRGYLEMSTFLLKNGALPSLTRKDGWTALMCAAYNNHLNIVHTLIEHGADPNQTTNDGWTALLSAANNGNEEVVGYLLQHGARPDDARRDNWAPLHAAITNGHPKIVQLLLDAKADPNPITHEGLTPLMAAVNNADWAVANLLLDHGASKILKNKYGETAFDLARKNDLSGSFQDLLKPGP